MKLQLIWEELRLFLLVKADKYRTDVLLEIHTNTWIIYSEVNTVVYEYLNTILKAYNL